MEIKRTSSSNYKSMDIETKTMYNGFWDHLKEQLLNTLPDFTCALKLLKEVKENLLSLLLPHQNRLRNEFEESLDMDLLKQETEYGALDVPHLSTHILNLMIMLCAQVGDEAVQKLESMTDPVQLLKGIFHVPGLMKMDIQGLQPYLKEHSVQYEQAKFQELLDKQPVFSYIPFYVVYLLDYTTKWLTKVATDLTTPSPSSPASPSSSSLAYPQSHNGAIQAYLNLLLWDPDNDKFPETLLMDRIRLQKMESHLHQLTVLASVLLVARCFSGNVLFNSPEFVDKLKCITKGHSAFCPLSRPQETMLSVREQVSREIHQGLKDMDLIALSTSLIGQLQNIAKKENCVRNIIDQRIRLFLKCCLVHGMQESLQDFPGGLSLIEGELAELSWKFFNLMHHNQQVFSPYYAEILKNIIPPAQAHETEVESI
uniref:T-complex 11 n=3 Tax=Canis lupus TaxID=9612 RepID=A0A8C0NKV9_CANLF